MMMTGKSKKTASPTPIVDTTAAHRDFEGASGSREGAPWSVGPCSTMIGCKSLMLVESYSIQLQLGYDTERFARARC